MNKALKRAERMGIMKVKTKLFRLIMLLLCFALLFVTGCSNNNDTETPTDGDGKDEVDIFTAGTEFVASGTQDGYSVVSDNANYTLLLDETTATLRVKNKKTGFVWKSNLTEEDFVNYSKIDESVKAEYMSQVDLVYYDGTGKRVNYNSYSYAVQGNDSLNKTVAYYQLSGGKEGVRVVYKIGESVDDAFFPAALTVDAYNALYNAMDDEGKFQLELYYLEGLLNYDTLSDAERASVTAEFKNIKQIDIYKSSQGSKIQMAAFVNDYLKPAIPKITKLSLKEWLEEEYEKIGYNFELPDVPMFVIPINYELTEQGLSVNVPTNEFQFEDSFRLYSIKILPFFGTVSNGDNGSMFIPDGSGALVNLNTQSKDSISLPFYGQDFTLRTKDYAENMEQATIPAFGLDVEDKTFGKNAFVAHVASGEGQGSVECHPKTSIYPFSYVGSTFEIHPFETFKSEGASQAAELQKYSDKPYKGNININYYFLNGDDADYVGMAKKIRSIYFGDREKISLDKTKFYFETYGEILRKETLVGYAFNAKTQMTTITQAKEIYEKLKTGGISNISMRYNNWSGDEYVNTISKVGKLAKGIGDKDEFKALIQLVEKDGGTLYPNLELVLDKDSGDLSSATWHNKMIEGTLANYSGRSNIYQEGVTVPFDRTVIKTGEILSKLSGINKRMDKFGVKGYSLSTIGSTLFSDYNKNTLLHRDLAKLAYVSILDKATNNGEKNLMVEMGNAYTYEFANDIINISLGNSNLLFEAESVPFVQIVVHGYISYAGSALNLSDNKEMTMLKSVEYGANLYYVLNYAQPSAVKSSNYSSLFSTNYERWYDEACAEYKSVSAVLDGVQSSCIVNHKKLAKDVFVTTYENGTSVVVNYSTTDYTYQNTKVPAKGFIAVK